MMHTGILLCYTAINTHAGSDYCLHDYPSYLGKIHLVMSSNACLVMPVCIQTDSNTVSKAQPS